MASSRITLTLRAFPTMLKIGLAEGIAYRAEMLVWMLSTTMPLVNLALWHTVAAGGAIAGFGQKDLVAYFLSSFIVRQMTGSWVVWEMNQELRSGRFSMRLLRPVHPLVAYAAENLAVLPLRGVLSVPIAIIALATAGAGHFAHDPLIWLMVCASLLGAWLLMFFFMSIMGAVGFFTESSTSLMYVWQALFLTLSGYIFPLDFLAQKAPRVMAALKSLPFYYQNGFPIELILGRHDRAAALAGLGMQWGYVAALGLGTFLIWGAGQRRWNAYGA